MNEIKIQLPKPHQGQAQVLNSNARFKVLLCGRRWGKSQIAQIIAVTKMLAGESIAYVTPTFDLSAKFFLDLLKVLPSEVIGSVNKTNLNIELITGGSMKFFSGESLTRFRGYKFHYVIVDEAAYIPDLKDQWNSAIRPTLSDYEGGALFISTPQGKDFFYSLYMKGVNLEEGFESFHFASNTNPYFPAAEFEQLRKDQPSFQFNQEYLAIPGENQNNPFGTDNINRNISPLSDKPTVAYGIDLARTFDYTVIIGQDEDGTMTYYDSFQQPWEISKQRIEGLPAGIAKVVDATGAGSVLYEQLQSTCQNIHGFVFTNESKTKIIYELIKDVEAGAVKYTQEVADELHVFSYKYSSTGVLTFNAMAGFHDDRVIALALANHQRKEQQQGKDWKLYFA